MASSNSAAVDEDGRDFCRPNPAELEPTPISRIDKIIKGEKEVASGADCTHCEETSSRCQGEHLTIAQPKSTYNSTNKTLLFQNCTSGHRYGSSIPDHQATEASEENELRPFYIQHEYKRISFGCEQGGPLANPGENCIEYTQRRGPNDDNSYLQLSGSTHTLYGQSRTGWRARHNATNDSPSIDRSHALPHGHNKISTPQNLDVLRGNNLLHSSKSSIISNHSTNQQDPLLDLANYIPDTQANIHMDDGMSSDCSSFHGEEESSKPFTTEAVDFPNETTIKKRLASKSRRKPAEERKTKSFEDSLRDLIEFKQMHGHCDVSVPSTDPNNTQSVHLLRWCKRQRYLYKLKHDGKDSSLTDEKIRLLNGIGFVWNARAVAWETRFEELAEYCARHGNCHVPQNYPLNPQLPAWIKRQRKKYLEKTLQPSRVQKLEGIGFVWGKTKI